MVIIKKEFFSFLNILSITIILLLIFNYKLIPEKTIDTYQKISSEAVIVMNARTKEVLFEKNSHIPMLTASICKVLTAYIAIKYLPLDKYVYINEEMINIEGSKIYLEVGDLVSIETLLYGLMLRSGNDAAKTLALAYNNNEADFVYLINEEVKKLNLKNSTFNNPSGLDDKTANYASCYDLAFITSVALENADFRTIFSSKTYKTTLPSGKQFYFVNKHRLVMNDPLVMGGKTGYTKKAGRTLITTFNIDSEEIIVVSMDAYNDWNLHKYLAESYGKR